VCIYSMYILKRRTVFFFAYTTAQFAIRGQGYRVTMLFLQSSLCSTQIFEHMQTGRIISTEIICHPCRSQLNYVRVISSSKLLRYIQNLRKVPLEPYKKGASESSRARNTVADTHDLCHMPVGVSSDTYWNCKRCRFTVTPTLVYILLKVHIDISLTLY
jgi:hypothetical protein